MAHENTHPQFQSLLNAFCQSVGLPFDADAHALTFEAAGHMVRVLADPCRDGRLLVDVAVGQLSEPKPALLLMLHQLNDAARIEHDWVATVGPTHSLSLYSRRAIDQTGAGDLQDLLAEGIDRAQSLAALCEGFPEDKQSEVTAFEPAAVGMVRV